MNPDPRLSYRTGSRGGFAQPGLFTRIVALSIGALVVGTAVVAAIMFSLVVLPVILLVGAVGVGYLWFKTRPLRRQLNAQMQEMREALARQQGAMPGARDVPGGAAARGRDSSGHTGPRRPAADDVIDGDFIRETGSSASNPTTSRQDPRHR